MGEISSERGQNTGAKNGEKGRMEWEGLSEMAWKRKVEEMCEWTLRTSENACGNLFLWQLPKVYIYMYT